MKSSYSHINIDHVVSTIDELHEHTLKHFPNRGIVKLSSEIRCFAQNQRCIIDKILRPIYYLRVGLFSIFTIGAALLSYWLYKIYNQKIFFDAQTLEAFINIIIFVSAGTWFLLNLETRIKRNKILHQLNKLRSFGHILDMHQLTKDPYFEDEMNMNGKELIRYLDYCADYLSCCGKIAANYLEYSDDPVVINAVNDFESLTGQFNRKIWQKISILA